MTYTAAEARDLRMLYPVLPKLRLIESFERSWKAITSKANAMGARRKRPGKTESPLRHTPATRDSTAAEAQLAWLRFCHEYFAVREQQMKESK
jgi:hypothetical protein